MNKKSKSQGILPKVYVQRLCSHISALFLHHFCLVLEYNTPYPPFCQAEIPLLSVNYFVYFDKKSVDFAILSTGFLHFPAYRVSPQKMVSKQLLRVWQQRLGVQLTRMVSSPITSISHQSMMQSSSRPSSPNRRGLP